MTPRPDMHQFPDPHCDEPLPLWQKLLAVVLYIGSALTPAAILWWVL